MKFNSDCMKIVCKYIEEHLEFSQTQKDAQDYFATNDIPFEEILDLYSTQHKQFTRNEVIYVLKILSELDYIQYSNSGGSGKYVITGFTPKGYEFLLYKIHKFN